MPLMTRNVKDLVGGGGKETGADSDEEAEEAIAKKPTGECPVPDFSGFK